MRGGPVAAAASILLTCSSATRSAAPQPDVAVDRPQPSRWFNDGCNENGVCLVFMRKGKCANWDEAMKIARTRACCGIPGHPNRGDRSCKCQKAAECDLCLFLNDDRPPVTTFKDMSAHGWNHPIGPEDTLLGHSRHRLDIQKALCTGSQNVEMLASTMVHEADHMCHETTYEFNPDIFGRRDRATDECHAIGVERACGFNPDPATSSTGCF